MKKNKMYSQRVRIFGPSKRQQQPYFTGAALQRGEGLFNVLGKLARKFIPFASKAAKKIVKSDLGKDVGRVLLNTATDIGTDALSNIIEGRDEILSDAKSRISDARKDVADAVRKRKIFGGEQKDSNLDESQQPKRKRQKRQKSQKRKSVKFKVNPKKKLKRFNLFEELEDVS